LNGTVKQDLPVTEMIFAVDVIIAFVTRCMTLEPGDLIATGTPPGVGPMLPGDTIHVEVTGIGVLQNTVIRG
jgi:2-keto-4-pentenoate hydratase/2-oxohepta-3-ene-1,7-dioic acid hydratase in catechol pathway